MLLALSVSGSEMLSVLQGVTQSLNDQLSEVWRHERTGWVPGLARLDSEVGRGQVRKDLGDSAARGLAEQRHGYGRDLGV